MFFETKLQAKNRRLAEVLLEQMRMCLRKGINDEFQRGYANALRYSWQVAGFPDTPETIAIDACIFAEYVPLEDAK